MSVLVDELLRVYIGISTLSSGRADCRLPIADCRLPVAFMNEWSIKILELLWTMSWRGGTRSSVFAKIMVANA